MVVKIEYINRATRELVSTDSKRFTDRSVAQQHAVNVCVHGRYRHQSLIVYRLVEWTGELPK